MKHKNTQPLYIFNRENPQNFEPQNDPRSGLDYIALQNSIQLEKNMELNIKGFFIYVEFRKYAYLPVALSSVQR